MVVVVEVGNGIEVLMEKAVDFDRLSPLEQIKQIELEEIWTAAELQKRQFLRRQREEKRRIAEGLDMLDRANRMLLAFNVVF